jgi:hypothetical protein
LGRLAVVIIAVILHLYLAFLDTDTQVDMVETQDFLEVTRARLPAQVVAVATILTPPLIKAPAQPVV